MLGPGRKQNIAEASARGKGGSRGGDKGGGGGGGGGV